MYLSVYGLLYYRVVATVGFFCVDVYYFYGDFHGVFITGFRFWCYFGVLVLCFVSWGHRYDYT